MNILLSGYYGFNNIGDEAVLGGILAGLRAELPEVTPVVLSADPAGTTALHGVAAIPRMQFGAVRTALREAALFVSGGGSLLQDVTSTRSLLYYLALLGLAQYEAVRTMICAQGIGPLTRPLSRLLTCRTLNRVAAITVRDSASSELLRDLGVTIPPIEVTADPSFLLEPEESPELAEWWASHIPAERPVLGVALRSWRAGKSAAQYHAISDALAAVAQSTGALLLFIPMQHAADLPVADEIAGWTPAESRVLRLPVTPRQMLDVTARCDFLLAMRLHTLIFAVHRGVPALGLSYDPKVFDFSLTAGLPAPLPWERIAAGELTSQLQKQWDRRAELRAALADTTPRLTALARRNLACLKALLTGA